MSLVAVSACGTPYQLTSQERARAHPMEGHFESRERAVEAFPAEPAAPDLGQPDLGAPDLGPPDLGPIDAAATPCFTDAPATRFVSPPYASGSFRATVRSSAPIATASAELTVRPGTTVRFDLAIENVSAEPVRFSSWEVEALRVASVMGLSARWTTPVTSAIALQAGHTLAPGAVLRLCATFEVPRTPIDAGPPGVTIRSYGLGWPGFSQPRGAHLGLGRHTIVVRYPREPAGPVRRETGSWGGVIRLTLAEGASVAEIARQTGVRIGSGIPLFGGADQPTRAPREALPTRPSVFVQAPPEMRVADAALALAARPEVLSAVPLMQGDPGSEGCSEYSPCARGEQCCYMCGVPGCALNCYRGSSCPMGIP